MRSPRLVCSGICVYYDNYDNDDNDEVDIKHDDDSSKHKKGYRNEILYDFITESILTFRDYIYDNGLPIGEYLTSGDLYTYLLRR